jgi:hypothetical protein
MTELSLVDYIHSLRSDLQRSIAGASLSGVDLRFLVSDIELDLEVRTEKVAHNGEPVIASFTFFVVSSAKFDANGSLVRTEADTHRVRLRLKPVFRSQPDAQVLFAVDRNLENPESPRIRRNEDSRGP